MSATGRGTVRNADDFYATPEWTVRALLDELWTGTTAPRRPVWDLGVWLEPCAGNGAIVKAVKQHMGNYAPIWDLVELRAEERNTLSTLCSDNLIRSITCPQDFLTWQTERHYDFSLTNVPFTYATEFVIKAMTMCDYFCTLQRLNWLGSKKRRDFWKQNPADVFVLDRRPGFTSAGTDSTEYAWFLFGPGCGNFYMNLNTEKYD